LKLEELKMMQNYPLWMKVERTKQRIREWYEYHNGEVYVSFSGGKDSTVLLHLIREVCGYKNIPVVYVDTGLEYPEVKEFVKSTENVTILRPKMSFKEVIEKYGYPVVSKEQANYLDDIRTSTPQMRERRINGDAQGRFKLSKKYQYLIDAPFKVSHRCCLVMKKKPVKKYEKETGRVPFVGMMAEESNLRKQSYLKNGCNAFESKRPMSTPLGFWREKDVLEYIYKNNIKME
jgi:3'-phosphoadenosine 5'-phosphosulfate sulfotransferase (PAPS reductase)/FAD synthetase